MPRNWRVNALDLPRLGQELVHLVRVAEENLLFGFGDE
jgi:hypothetical protein